MCCEIACVPADIVIESDTLLSPELSLLAFQQRVLALAEDPATPLRERLRYDETEAFIIGGGEIYKQTMHLLDKIYVTEVDLDTEGDVFFPELKQNDWKLVSEEKHSKNEKNEWDFSFKVFERI